MKSIEKRLAGVVPVVSTLVVVFGFYIAIWRTLLWEILNPFLAANYARIENLLSLSPGSFAPDMTVIVRAMCWFIIIAVPILLIWRKPLTASKLVSFIPLGLILLAAFASQWWSVDPESTQKRFLFFFAVTLAGVYMGIVLSKDAFLRAFEAFAAIMSLGCYLMLVKYPDFAIMTGIHEGAWRGIFDHKNMMGITTAFFALTFLFRLLDFKKIDGFTRFYSVIFFILTLILVYFSDSAAGLLIFAAGIGVLVLAIAYLRWGVQLSRRGWWATAAAALIVLAAAWIFRDSLFGLIGRNATFTGRVPLWQAIMPYVAEKPWLGYGFGEVFWRTLMGESVTAQMRWDADMAHNGYVQALLDTGWVGLVLYIIFFVQAIYFPVKYFIAEKRLPAVMFLAWSLGALLANVVENKLGTFEIFVWMMLAAGFAVTAISVGKNQEVTHQK